ncbi:MAG: Asp23/Gls24 family envelope stress response protein [Erysipelotrichaceae bacterium]|nr:Asp23/Gls24 family envelope stress response protein [Erysipelotrichaceae bacterium]
MAEDNEVLNVSDDVLAVCAINATLKTEGVAEMAGGITNIISKKTRGKELVSKGAKVTRVTKNKDQIEIDLHVIVSYGCKIPQVAWDIQENVKNEIRSMTNMKLNAVNIHVEGVKRDDEE